MQTVEAQSKPTRTAVQPGALETPIHDPGVQKTRPLLYEVTGHGDPIVLMPGSLTGWLSWISHAERLAKNHMVVRAQLRSVELVEAGEPVPDSYGVMTEREALLATVDALGLDQFDLVGWSGGGLVSLAFAFRHPERVRTLTLIEPSAPWVLKSTGQADAAFTAEEAAFRALGGKDITVDDLKSFLVWAGLGTEDTDFESHPRWPVLVRNRQALSIEGREWDYADSLEDLRTLNVPILAVKGSDTAPFLGSIVEAIAAIAPNATLLELLGGHACHQENPDDFLAALEAHIAN